MEPLPEASGKDELHDVLRQARRTKVPSAAPSRGASKVTERPKVTERAEVAGYPEVLARTGSASRSPADDGAGAASGPTGITRG